MNCPNCKKSLYPVCDNKKCVCWQRIPNGESALITQQCPYCDYTANGNIWMIAEIEQFLEKNNVKSFAELAKIK